ncbi:peptidoglycan -binding protein [Pseudogemmobacter blasticus]|uniref:Peptidoglycan-binding protein n=1 Tax=Fuscovulum blasticum DSM 2131 TaxID=1188250 RepID=A0A2T4J7R0_FUSBL|nr:peptidoglycan -binding protein [Fuscovulum blasticum]PTE13934.1 peptidoglycan-binding protein [Fuscovulum blasticum DSM 2131]
MGLSRRRDSNMIWPGFVDAVTTLLMVMMFVLTIFTLMQAVLRDTITTKDNELSALNEQVAALSQALGLERNRASDLEAQVGRLTTSLAEAEAAAVRQDGVIAGLRADLATRSSELSAAAARITAFEAEVAALVADRDKALSDLALVTKDRDSTAARAEGLAATVAELEAAKVKLISDAEAMQIVLAKAREEIDVGAEAARLAAARTEALEALVADLRKKGEADGAALEAAKVSVSEAEARRLADAAALEELRKRLAGSETELTAMTLALEAERLKAEQTLTLLAAARAAASTTTGEKDAALKAAEAALTAEQDKALKAAREVELLNRQIADLRGQLAGLQEVLDAARSKDEAAQVQLDTLGSQLNAALAQVAAEQKKRAELEEAERKRLEAEKANLETFRSEFFGQLSRLLAGREGVRVVGDRFVFSSEVLFQPGAADLSPEGKAQIASVVQILNEIKGEIPAGIDWIIRVDGHTDNQPLSGLGEFKDNWQLSQARALSVVRYMQTDLGFPPDRLAATGFGEYRPVVPGDSEAARAQNRRIELKLTER